MKFMFFSEAETLPGASYQTRYWELVEQVIHAEKWGFDVFGVSEQQYAIGGIATSCPEVLFGYLFPLTKTLRFAHAITLMPKRMNHALRIASRTAVQDILSNGRIELGVGRGNTTLALRAFEVDLEKNRDEVNEGIQILKKAFTEDPFMFYGEHYKIPPRSLVPKPLQSPHPPIAVAATSAESHRMAGNLGVGVYSWSNFMGWDALAELVSAFRAAIGETRARGEHVNDSAGALLQAYCAETDEIAEAEAGAGNLKWLRIAIDGYPRLAKVAQSYSYMNKIAEVAKKTDDFAYFKEGLGRRHLRLAGELHPLDREVPRLRHRHARDAHRQRAARPDHEVDRNVRPPCHPAFQESAEFHAAGGGRHGRHPRHARRGQGHGDLCRRRGEKQAGALDQGRGIVLRMGRILEFLTLNVATDDINAALAKWRALGLADLPLAHMPEPPVEIDDVTLPLGKAGAVSLIAPTGPGSPVRRFLDRRGPGAFSLAVRVDSLSEVMEEWKAAGIEWVLPAPQLLPPGTPAARYKPERLLVNWVKPTSLGGIMLEVFEFEGRVEQQVG